MKPQAHLEIVMVPTDDLKMYENNAKQHPTSQVEQIANSIEEFNFADPIAAWHNDDGESVIVEGHGRLMAAQKLGIEELPVIYLDYMSDSQRKAYAIAHNALTMNSDFDFDLLAIEVDGLSVDFDMEQFGVEIAGATVGDEEVDETDAVGSEPSFNYKEQYGVIVMCSDEADQELVYNRLTDEGYTCKVVAV